MSDQKTVSNEHFELEVVAKKLGVKPSKVLDAKEVTGSNDREVIEQYLNREPIKQMSILTWKDLKEFLHGLNDEQLSQPAIVINAPEESVVKISDAEISDTTYVYNEDSEGLIPIDEYDPYHYDGKLLEDDSYNTIIPPGRVFVYEEDSTSLYWKPKHNNNLKPLINMDREDFEVIFKKVSRILSEEVISNLGTLEGFHTAIAIYGHFDSYLRAVELDYDVSFINSRGK